MNASELKFLLKLLKHPDYRASFGKLEVPDKARLCQNLADRDLVQYSRKITQFRIEPAGKAILKQDLTQLPVTEQQLMVLKACETKAIVPSNISNRQWSAAERQAAIQDLALKGLIKVEKFQITEVWLTDRGTEFLRDEFNPTGNSTISLNLLGSYLIFLRKAFRSLLEPETPTQSSAHIPSDDEVLQMIRELDRKVGSDNYLPIFHLRQQLEPILSRDDLDQALYRLQRQDRLEISALVESVHYTLEQVQAGIPQEAGGPLFFLMVNED